MNSAQLIATSAAGPGTGKSFGIRCPVHNYITFDGPLIPSLMNTQAFQRLRGITQLGACTKVFPSANHTRFEHCVGVAHLCVQYAKRFESMEKQLLALLPTKCTASLKDLLSVSGLLHDIAHGPFSHDWDTAVYSKLYPGVEKGHDEVRKMIVKNDLEIVSALFLSGLTPQNVIDCWTTKPLSQMVSGYLSADQMDYISRDSYMLGMQHIGGVDPIRIISNAVIESNELRFRANCRNDIDIFLNSRSLAYDQIYKHPVVQQYATLLQIMMDRLYKEDPKVHQEMLDYEHFRKWTETYFFHRYLCIAGEQDVLYEQWVTRQRLK